MISNNKQFKAGVCSCMGRLMGNGLLCMVSVLMLSSCNKPKTVDAVKTTFQSSKAWSESIDVRADAVMVYGVGGDPSQGASNSLESRIKSWKERGYETHFMTGIAWGGYQDYFTGEWDGQNHLADGQVTHEGDTLWHGHMVPYIVPSKTYLEYMKEKHIKRVIDAGVDHIFMEEPEFWAWGGYGETFKKEWQDYYGFPWRPQHESPENTWLSNKLKYHLYYRALDEVFSYAKEYGKSLGRDIKCYVPTHSLVNYSQWRIVSPEASLASLPSVDGYIAQVWTGTSREPNFYNGVRAERVFENAYLEYGSMESMTAPTGRKMFFLTDPIEDWPRDWADYKRNYEATFTAQLLYPNIDDYEIMPWPNRIYNGLYKVSADSEEKIGIPRFYSTQMQIMINALGKMPLSDNQVSGSQGLAVLMSNSLMFQRFPEHEGYEDPQLANFYGQALPFLKKGIPVKTAHMENLSFEGTLKDVKILLMSYSNMKPMEAEAHDYLAAWVKKGGVLVYSCRDNDPFQKVMEWWNTGDNHYTAPADHLFEKMGIPAGAEAGEYVYGKGKVQIIRQDPKEFILKENGDENYVKTVAALYEQIAAPIEFKNNFYLQRGIYDIASVMTESVSEEPLKIEGVKIDLYDHELTVYDGVEVAVGTQGLFVAMDRVDRSRPQIVAAAAREYDEVITENSYSFVVKSPAETTNTMRVVLPQKPVKISVNGEGYPVEGSWDELSGTCLLKFENHPDGVKVELNW